MSIYNILFVFDAEPENYSYLMEENYLHQFLAVIWLNLLLMGSRRASSVVFFFFFFAADAAGGEKEETDQPCLVYHNDNFCVDFSVFTSIHLLIYLS